MVIAGSSFKMFYLRNSMNTSPASWALEFARGFEQFCITIGMTLLDWRDGKKGSRFIKGSTERIFQFWCTYDFLMGTEGSTDIVKKWLHAWITYVSLVAVYSILRKQVMSWVGAKCDLSDIVICMVWLMGFIVSITWLDREIQTQELSCVEGTSRCLE